MGGRTPKMQENNAKSFQKRRKTTTYEINQNSKTIKIQTTNEAIQLLKSIGNMVNYVKKTNKKRNCIMRDLNFLEVIDQKGQR